MYAPNTITSEICSETPAVHSAEAMGMTNGGVRGHPWCSQHVLREGYGGLPPKLPSALCKVAHPPTAV